MHQVLTRKMNAWNKKDNFKHVIYILSSDSELFSPVATILAHSEVIHFLSVSMNHCYSGGLLKLYNV